MKMMVVILLKMMVAQLEEKEMRVIERDINGARR